MKKIIIALLLLSQVSLFAQDYKFGKVSKEELEEKFYPLDSTADAAYLYRERKSYFEYNQSDGFQIVTEIKERIKIYSKEGYKKATKEIKYYNPDKGNSEKIKGLKGYTFSLLNGNIKKEKISKKSIFDEKKSKYWSVKKITFPSINKGVIIDLEYRKISPYYSIDDLEFQFDIPVKQLNYDIDIPEYFKYTKKSKGYYSITPKLLKKSKTFSWVRSGKTDVSKVGLNRTTSSTETLEYVSEKFSFSDKNIPPLKDDESFIYNINNYRGGIKFELSSIEWPNSMPKYFTNTWEDVSKQIYKSSNFGSELEKTNYYESDIKTLLEGKTNNLSKIGAIFQFVKSKVKWNGYYSKYTDKGVRKAYKEGVGNIADINLMLTSMLRSAGLDANPVLVSTRANGVPLFPTLEGFNYVISMVEFPDNTYVLLDASEPYSLPNILPVRALNWNGRKVTKDGNSSWVKLASSKLSGEDNNVMVKITEDFNVEGLVRTKYSNLKALNFRKNNNHIKEEDLIAKLEEKNKIEIENYKLNNINNITKPIGRTIKFKSEDLIEGINGKLYIEPLLFFTERTNPFKLEDRKFPVEFDSPFNNKNTVSIQIPEGYKVETLPESLAIGLPENLGVFQFQTSTAGNKINTICIIQFNSAIIAPQYYTALKDFYGQMVKKQSEKIVLVKM